MKEKNFIKWGLWIFAWIIFLSIWGIIIVKSVESIVVYCYGLFLGFLCGAMTRYIE